MTKMKTQTKEHKIEMVLEQLYQAIEHEEDEKQ
jgi:hypothetical protein